MCGRRVPKGSVSLNQIYHDHDMQCLTCTLNIQKFLIDDSFTESWKKEMHSRVIPEFVGRYRAKD